MKNPLIAQIAAITGALILFFLVYVAPHVKPETGKVSSGAGEDLNIKIDHAVEMVKNDRDPMKGIMMLKKTLEENPKNPRVHLNLGIFSLQTGQYEKALEHFKAVIDSDPGITQAYYYLGQTYEELKNTEKAEIYYNKYKTLMNDSSLVNEVEKHI